MQINVHLLPNLAPETVGTHGRTAFTTKHADSRSVLKLRGLAMQLLCMPWRWERSARTAASTAARSRLRGAPQVLRMACCRAASARCRPSLPLRAALLPSNSLSLARACAGAEHACGAMWRLMHVFLPCHRRGHVAMIPHTTVRCQPPRDICLFHFP